MPVHRMFKGRGVSSLVVRVAAAHVRQGTNAFHEVIKLIESFQSLPAVGMAVFRTGEHGRHHTCMSSMPAVRSLTM